MSQPSPATSGQPMPTPTRVGVILLALLAVLLLANAVLTWFGQEVIIDQIADAGVDRDEAARTVLMFLLVYAVVGLSAGLAAGFLPRRRSWARQVGVMVTSLLVVMTVFSALTGGGISPVTLLVLVAAVAGLTSLLSRQTKTWIRGGIRTD